MPTLSYTTRHSPPHFNLWRTPALPYNSVKFILRVESVIIAIYNKSIFTALTQIKMTAYVLF